MSPHNGQLKHTVLEHYLVRVTLICGDRAELTSTKRQNHTIAAQVQMIK